MKVAVLGSGLMGKEAARDLVHSPGVTHVGLADIHQQRAEAVVEALNSPKLSACQVDAGNEHQLETFLRDYDVVINALFYSFNEIVARTAVRAGVHSVDLGGHIGHITDRVLELDEEAKKAGVTIIPDLGVAPGMINILSGYGAGKLDSLTGIKLFVGGIPVRPEPPLEYNHVFSMEGLLDHYSDPSTIIRKGKLEEVESLTEIESIYFDRFGPLEAFHTSGGTSTLLQSYPDIDTLEYKTIRYPGHAAKMKLLVDLNLTGAGSEVEVDGRKVSTRKVLLKSIDPLLELKEKDDAVLLRVLVEGRKAEVDQSFCYEMITYKDREANVTAMARATANTISVAAQMIGSGRITKRGVCPPERIVPGDLYIREMAKRGVVITEKNQKV
ncbi:saccharopine dehydrogenase family protein [Halobacillus litoralis]|uniref:saccharopine dehydrogenase family protein n=1 Tax=Halobacillus litoralis TaxID=45668 RepID=UPI00136DE466|nr:saccharopine dehydrogenase C-terminal domain-containing protein [Halobacillus litoralis]MYL36939.1 saccharopine dehydrogenase [Halobacillus litoralis]